MKKSLEDNQKDKRFELLKELLLEDDRKKFDVLSDQVLLQEKISEHVEPLINQKIEDFREDFREDFPKRFGSSVTETIKIQIRESQDEVVEALYPIMGRLIKKAIVNEINKLSEKINKTLNRSLSFREIIKKYFGRGRKKHNGDTVLQDVFEPIIEEVFVIEKKNGLLAGSYSRGNIADKDMVSGMLTAIKSFAEDAFSKGGQDLENIKFETFQISIQNFKTIYIAIATSGVVNSKFRDQLSDNTINLAEIILRNRSYLLEDSKLSVLIKKHLIQE